MRPYTLGALGFLCLSALLPLPARAQDPGDAPDAWPVRAGGVLAVSPVLVSSDYQTLVTTAREGMGLALLPLHVVSADLVSGRLVHVLPELGRDMNLYAVTAQDRHYLPKVRAFFTLVDEFIARYEPQ